MKRTALIGLVVALALSGCASGGEWARTDPRNRSYVPAGPIVAGMDVGSVMAAACLRKRANGTMDAKWDAYCKGRGL